MSSVLSGIRCTGDSSFGCDDYFVVKHGILVPLLKNSSIVVGGCRDSESKKLRIRANNLFHRLQDSIKA